MTPRKGAFIILIAAIIGIVLIQFASRREEGTKLDIESFVKARHTDRYSIDHLTLAPKKELIVVTDNGLSGAYNMFTMPYLVDNEKVKPVYIVRTDKNNEVVQLDKDFIDGDKVNPDTLDVKEYNFNNYITDGAFHIYGMKAFGLYPCNVDEKYEFSKDRFILVSKTQIEGCDKLDIQGPMDIPEDMMEREIVEIFKATPAQIEAAKKVELK